MTTLTRTRTAERVGGYDRIHLGVDGPAGIITFRLFSGSGGGFVDGVWVCSRTERLGAEYEERCPISHGPCWGDWLGRSASMRLLDAWQTDHPAAVYAVLEELYRSEFGGES